MAINEMLHSSTQSWTFNSEKEGPEDGLAVASAITWMAKVQTAVLPSSSLSDSFCTTEKGSELSEERRVIMFFWTF